MIRVKEAILVEGRYDKNLLKQILETVVIETDGFGIFKDREKQAYIRRLGKERGVIILTDSDGAGFVIRNYLKGILPREQVKHAYIPDIPGKEKRKKQPGKEGMLGVEGMQPEVLLQALQRAGATFQNEDEVQEKAAEHRIEKADLVRLGLAGGPGSGELRKELQHRLKLPKNLSANGLLEALNTFYSLEYLESEVQSMKTDPGN